MQTTCSQKQETNDFANLHHHSAEIINLPCFWGTSSTIFRTLPSIWTW